MTSTKHGLFFIILLMNSFGAILAPNKKNDQECLSSSSTYHPLPIIMMQSSESNELNLPLYLPDLMVSVDKHGSLLGKTKFSGLSSSENTIFFCPRTSNGINENVEADLYTLIPKKFNDDELLRCEKEAMPVIREITARNTDTKQNQQQHARCGSGGLYYKFIYQLINPTRSEKQTEEERLSQQKESETVELEIYRFCFSHSNNQILFTEYDIKSPVLLGKQKLTKERESYCDMMTEGYEYFADIFQKKKDLYIKSRYLEVLKTNPTDANYTPNDLEEKMSFPFKPEHLVEPDNMAFALWRKPTFHSLNLNYMHKELKKYWNRVNFLIKHKAMGNYRNTHRIYTGTFNTLDQNSGEIQEVTQKGEIHVPKIWVKLILVLQTPKESYSGLAIVMNNHMDDNHEIDSLFKDQRCNDTVCPNIFKRGEFQGWNKFIRCCHVVKKIQNLFDLNLEIDETPLSLDYVHPSRL